MSLANQSVNQAAAAEHGLSASEYESMMSIMGRTPSVTELGIFSVMWSEHCSYKSSKRWLMTLPTTGPQVICGPGENAGVVDIGDGLAAVFKIESHNHPSFIEPRQGAATGVGGIMRDIFTMGARPVANLNALRFGDPDHPKTRHLVSGVVAGIGGYGNCMGIPTVGGETNFDPAYNGNILVNAMTVGVAPANKIFYSAATGIGNPVVYVGSKTGRDGIHGATMASAEFSEDSEEKRPTVQVGDPFTEKLLLEACLELMATDAIIAIQDMGAAGLTCSTVEMADKGGVGIELNLDEVPIRETGMTPYEIMLSESQERMLMVLHPGEEDIARAIFEKWELDFAIVGTVTDTGHVVVKSGADIVADIPVKPLVEASPLYDRPWEPSTPRPVLAPDTAMENKDPMVALVQLLGSPNGSSRRWIWEQYDHMVMGDTVQRPGGDSAIVRLHGTNRGLAITTDCTPRYCAAAPETGGRQAAAEAWRNLIAVGATPLALTNNLNFGNPERPEIMGQFVECVKGISAAATALDFPVVSGNVSLYNETNGEAILPTPVIGGLGLIDDIDQTVAVGFTDVAQDVILIGDTTGWLGASAYLKTVEGRDEGAPPPVEFEVEKRNGIFIRDLIRDGAITACHDISDGGVLVTVAEMAMAGNIGASVTSSGKTPLLAWLFGEDQARYVVTTKDSEAIVSAAKMHGVSATIIGRTGGVALTVDDTHTISVKALQESHEYWLPNYMAAP